MSTQKIFPTRILHTMLRIGDKDASLFFYTKLLGMKVLRQQDYPSGTYTLIFLGYGSEKDSTVVELTYNWGERDYVRGDDFGHLALAVTDIKETCEFLRLNHVNILREPGPMKDDSSEFIAFVEDPDGFKIELIQTT